VGVAPNLPALAPLVVGVEDKAPLVEALEEHDACRRLPVRRRGGEDHGVRLVEIHGEGLLKPRPELG
jgi:hypothetical protein